jgi:nucleotide-binding universal stress UspA family protein
MAANREPRDASDGTSGRVVVGVHGSRSSLLALRHAADVARDRGWDLDIVTAWPDVDEPLIHDVPGRYIAARGRALDCQWEAVASLDPVLAPRVQTFLVNARPAQALIGRCGDADLLVVGAGDPKSQLHRPSVAAECVASAPCAVTVVPDPDADPVTGSPARTPPEHRRHRRPRGSKAGTASSA